MVERDKGEREEGRKGEKIDRGKEREKERESEREMCNCMGKHKSGDVHVDRG